jgi:replicative DNA helicase
MKTDIYESSILTKIFYNKDLQERYLDDMILGLFSNKTRRLILFIMQEIRRKGMIVSLDNIMLLRQTPPVMKFMNKIKFPNMIAETDLSEHLGNTTIDASSNLFIDAYNILHDEAFANYVASSTVDFSYEIAYKNRAGIIAKIRAMQNAYNIIYKSKSKDRRDQIGDAFANINKSSAYLQLSSKRLTATMGGFSKGYIGSAIGRPSHNKSTWFTFDSTWQINNNNLEEVHVIGAEESTMSFWRRVFAIELGITINDLVYGLKKISEIELKIVRDKYEGKLFFHEVRKLGDIVDLIMSLKVPYIWIDHINAIDYPKGDMYRGIIDLVNYEKDWLVTNNESVIVNLSQVNTKQMKYKNRMFPSKEDAYMSSILEQASREFISFYYPYKDIIDKEQQHKFAGKGKIYGPDLVQVSVEKNSLGDIGIIDMKYHHEYGKFEDLAPMNKEVSNVILGEERTTDLFDKLM